MFSHEKAFYTIVAHCCGNHLSQWQMTVQTSKSLRSDKMLWFNAQRVKQRTNSCIEWHKRTR